MAGIKRRTETELARRRRALLEDGDSVPKSAPQDSTAIVREPKPRRFRVFQARAPR